MPKSVISRDADVILAHIRDFGASPVPVTWVWDAPGYIAGLSRHQLRSACQRLKKRGDIRMKLVDDTWHYVLLPKTPEKRS